MNHFQRLPSLLSSPQLEQGKVLIFPSDLIRKHLDNTPKVPSDDKTSVAATSSIPVTLRLSVTLSVKVHRCSKSESLSAVLQDEASAVCVATSSAHHAL